MKKRFIVGIFLLINIYSFGQNKYLKDVNDTQLLSEKVVDLFAENKIKQSFNTLSVSRPEIAIQKKKSLLWKKEKIM